MGHKQSKMTLSVALGVALGWLVLLGSARFLDVLDGTDLALFGAVAVATTGSVIATAKASRPAACRREVAGSGDGEA